MFFIVFFFIRITIKYCAAGSKMGFPLFDCNQSLMRVNMHIYRHSKLYLFARVCA